MLRVRKFENLLFATTFAVYCFIVYVLIYYFILFVVQLVLVWVTKSMKILLDEGGVKNTTSERSVV